MTRIRELRAGEGKLAACVRPVGGWVVVGECVNQSDNVDVYLAYPRGPINWPTVIGVDKDVLHFDYTHRTQHNTTKPIVLRVEL
tara:strand:- start:573 stop:824 length:252 start_codon:yes stop_codon:yes gene_type:complete